MKHSFGLLITVLVANAFECNRRFTPSGQICVCNATYCDTVPILQPLAKGHYQLYSTSEESLGFSSVSGFFSNKSQPFSWSVSIAILTETHQSILGFGGAFTDATGINIASLSNKTQELLLHAYFGSSGVGYSVGRVPIGGTDFSTRGYTYCDVKDESLESFELQTEDYEYKIPYLRRALAKRNGELKLFASAWSAPKWMKTKGKLVGFGKVKPEYYDQWARYYLKFFDAYGRHNVTFWGVTTQNEPFNGLIGSAVPGNGFTNIEMVNWIKHYFGPAIRNSPYKGLKIMGHDDQRALLPIFVWNVLADKVVLNYTDGVAVHYYTDFFAPPEFLKIATSLKDKEVFVLATEGCEGSLESIGLDEAVVLGSWSRAEKYLESIFGVSIYVLSVRYSKY